MFIHIVGLFYSYTVSVTQKLFVFKVNPKRFMLRLKAFCFQV